MLPSRILGRVLKADRLNHWPLKFPEICFNVDANDGEESGA